MKAAAQAQLRLLEVQAVDTAIAQIQHRRKSLPEHATIEARGLQRRRVIEAGIAANTEVSDLETEVVKAEADLVPVRERLIRNQQRVDDGAADPKALQALVDELVHLGQRISDLEDVQLEVMERLEDATAKRDKLVAERAEIENELRGQMASRDSQLAVLDAELATEQENREALVAEVPADLLALYDKIRLRSGGVGAARLVGKRCEGCQLEATSSAVNSYFAAAADDVLRCEECERILVRGA